MEATQSKYSNIDKNNIKSLISKCSIGNCNIIFDMLTLENIKMTKNNNGVDSNKPVDLTQQPLVKSLAF